MGILEHAWWEIFFSSYCIKNPPTKTTSEKQQNILFSNTRKWKLWHPQKIWKPSVTTAVANELLHNPLEFSRNPPFVRLRGSHSYYHLAAVKTWSFSLVAASCFSVERALLLSYHQSHDLWIGLSSNLSAQHREQVCLEMRLLLRQLEEFGIQAYSCCDVWKMKNLRYSFLSLFIFS